MPMPIIYLFYGLAFVMLGLGIIVARRMGDYFNISRDILPVGIFALIHGVNEWVDLFIFKAEPFNVEALKFIGSILLPVSFVFLLIFSARIIPQHYPKLKWLKFLWFLSLLPWLFTYFITKDLIISGIVARYFIALPGALLTAFSLYLVQKRVTRKEVTQIAYIGIRLAIFTFALYGLLAGLVVPKADFLLAGWLNYPNFTQLFGLPVQFFRMLCALILMFTFYGMFGVLLRDREILKTILIISVMVFVAETGIMQILHSVFPKTPPFVEGFIDSALLVAILFPFIYVSVLLEMRKRQKAEEELAKEREFLDVTFQSVGDGIIATDTKGKITLINRVAEALTGWKEKEAIGRPIEEVFCIINEETRQICPNPVERVLKAKAVIGLGNHTILVSRDKQERFLGDSGAPIRDDKGNIIGVVLVFRDISEAKKAGEKYRSIVNTSQDGFWLSDSEGRILEVNTSYCQLSGYTRDELLKMRIPDLEAQERPEEIVKHIQRVIDKGQDRFETRHRCKDGRLVDLEISVTYLKMDSGQFVVFIHDITERKQREELLEKFNKLSVGREMKMIELKKEIETLKQRLSHT